MSEPIYQDLDETGIDLPDQAYWDIGGSLSFSNFGDRHIGDNGNHQDTYVIDTGNGEVQIDVSTQPRKANVKVGYNGTDSSTGNADYSLSCDAPSNKKCDVVSIDDAACEGSFDDMDCDELTGIIEDQVDTYNSKQNLTKNELHGGLGLIGVIALLGLGSVIVNYFAERKKH